MSVYLTCAIVDFDVTNCQIEACWFTSANMYLFQSASCKGLAVTVLSPIFEQGQMTSCYFCCDISTPRSPKQKNQHTWPLLRGVKASATEYHNYEVHHGSLANNQHQQPETDQQLENSSMGRLKFLQILQDWALLAHNWTMYNCLAAPAGFASVCTWVVSLD